MARTWLSVTVHLLGGRGDHLWPPPGRVFAVGPSHTFHDLAEAIDTAFARWDRAHLSMFTLADGRVVTDGETGAEMASGAGGPILAPVDMTEAKVARTVALGAEFQYTFDLGDEWVHRCVVGEKKLDPMDELGIVPPVPLPYWGWGAIPDQYGRRWEDDDSTGAVPKRPSRPHPMLLRTWPDAAAVPELDLRVVRAATVAGDADAFLDAIAGRDVDDALQQLGAGIVMALERRRQRAEPIALSIINRLTSRGAAGDRVLADDLLGRLRRESPPARQVAVDLDMLSSHLEDEQAGEVYVDLQNGEVYHEDDTDPMTVGMDAAIDVDADPQRWLRLERTASRDAWNDMAAFAQRQQDHDLRHRLARATEGRGAFRRFRDTVHDEGIAEAWRVFSDDRRWGRARELLADAGVRVT
ncbi:MAG: hypothetical protein WBL06_05675 [Pseudolysinimonas sp.]|uniref:hypothetical protein n=1 Tax=Pseudolysinimonas sp. TaxID=2680009 RepID=UPI003C7383F1